jgi:excinuclease ABC subunit C
MSTIREHAQKLPDTPGVYFFIGKRKEVLYVGKATSLKDRVRSYFVKDLAETRGLHMVKMVEEAVKIEHRETDSVLEALILEAKLIKEIKPRYNTRDKDDKSFNYLVITTNETYPRLLTVRGKELQAKLTELGIKNEEVCITDSKSGSPFPVFGPFVHATQFKEALKIIRHIFPYYDTKYPVDELQAKNDRKLRFNQSIGVYPKDDTTPEEYAHTIRHIRLFFEAKKKQLLKALEADMKRYARAHEFERAGSTKRQLFALQHINDIALIRRERNPTSVSGVSIRIEGYDVAHLQGSNMVGVMTVVEGGEPLKAEYRTFTIRSVTKSNDTAALAEVLERRFGHPEWPYPRLIVVDGGKAQLNAARTVLSRLGIEIPIVAVTKDERHRPKMIQGAHKEAKLYAESILLVNAEAHRFSLRIHTKKRIKSMRT